MPEDDEDEDPDWLALDTRTPFERWQNAWFVATELAALAIVLWLVWLFDVRGYLNLLVDRLLG